MTVPETYRREHSLSSELKPGPGVVLAIEDDLQDIEILRLAIAQSDLPWKLIAVQFARDAIWYLGKVREHGDETLFPKPSLILLDLTLPGMSGIDFLT